MGRDTSSADLKEIPILRMSPDNPDELKWATCLAPVDELSKCSIGFSGDGSLLAFVAL